MRLNGIPHVLGDWLVFSIHSDGIRIYPFTTFHVPVFPYIVPNLFPMYTGLLMATMVKALPGTTRKSIQRKIKSRPGWDNLRKLKRYGFSLRIQALSYLQFVDPIIEK